MTKTFIGPFLLLGASLGLLTLGACGSSTGNSNPEPDAIDVAADAGPPMREVGPDPDPDSAPDPEPGPEPDGSADVEPDGEPDPGPGVEPTDGCSPTLAPSPLRRLTRREYNYVVEDILGVTSSPADAFAPEETTLGFDNNAGALWVSNILAEQFIDGAEQVSGEVTSMPDAIVALLPCDPVVLGERPCAEIFIDAFGTRALRRPMSADEAAGLLALYDDVIAAEGETFATAIASVIEALLLSPSFLYRVELGGSASSTSGVVAVADWEMASRLSFLFWASSPDQELYDAAAAGLLHTQAQIETQARRLLSDPKAGRTLGTFHRQWLHLDKLTYAHKDPAVYPGFDEELRGLLEQETQQFLESITLDENGTWADLMQSDRSFINARLASHYGIEGDFGTELVEVSGLANRGGIFTQGAILSALAKPNQSSPILRGVFVREKLLCEPLPPPPDDVDIQAPSPDPNLSTRERFAQHTEDTSCQGCHVLIDPIGFGFEDFDGVGRHRTHENGFPIDNSGEVLFSFPSTLSFHGPVDLAQQFATAELPQRCYAKHWFRFGYGRTEAAVDGCALDQIGDRFLETGGNLHELLVGLTQTPAFRYRLAQDPTEPDLPAPGATP